MAAFARSQLRRLDEYTAIAQRNGRLLNEALSTIPGLLPPVEPPDTCSVFHKYRVRFDLHALGIEVPAQAFRDRLVQALRAEGVDAVLWHTEPVTSYPIFQTHAGIGHDYPWSLAPGAGAVDPADYPHAIELLQSSIVVCDEVHPIMIQELELIELYAEAFRKVLRDPAQLVEVRGDG